MDRIIKSISEIETDSVKIMEDANEKKAEIFAQVQRETADYDKMVEGETNKRILALRDRLEQDMYDRLAQQKAAADGALSSLEKHYEENHADYAEQLFNTMTGV